jgi:DNA-binding transcriptional ArsR family regulator
LVPSTPDHLSTTLAALSDPTRRAILARLAAGEATVTELAAPFAMSMPAVSRHLAPLKDVADWLAHYQRFWTESLDRLDDYLRGVQKEEK